MNRAELIERARLGFEQVDPDLLAGVLLAADKYDPAWQAVVLFETPELCCVSIVGYDRSETVASISFGTTN